MASIALTQLAVPAAARAPGELDPAFSGGAVSHRVADTTRVLVRPSGGLLLGGTAPTSGVGPSGQPYTWNTVAHVGLRGDGSLDASHGQGGSVITAFGWGQYAEGKAIAFDAEGRILMGGTGAPAAGRCCLPVVLRYLADGRLDPTFGTGGYVMLPEDWRTNIVSAVTPAPDGDVIVAGYNHGPGFVARLEPNGRLDPGFGDGGKVFVDLQTRLWDLAVQPDGRILAAGTAPGTLRRWLPDGRPDPTFGSGGVADATLSGSSGFTGVALGPGGTIVVSGGQSADVADNLLLVARFDASGRLDPTFAGDGSATLALGSRPTGTGLDAHAWEVAVQRNGKIVAVGYERRAGPNAATYLPVVARFLPDGRPDAGFGRGGVVELEQFPLRGRDVALQQDGKIVVAVDGWATAVRLLGDGEAGAPYVPPAAGGGGRGSAPQRRTRLVVRRGAVVRVPVRCPAARRRGCRGTLSLTSGGRLLGRRAVRLRSAAPRVVTLRLRPVARRLLRARSPLPATIRTRWRGGGSTVTRAVLVRG